MTGTHRRPKTRKGMTREMILFLLGVALIVNESLFRHDQANPLIVALAAGFVGMPLVTK